MTEIYASCSVLWCSCSSLSLLKDAPQSHVNRLFSSDILIKVAYSTCLLTIEIGSKTEKEMLSILHLYTVAGTMACRPVLSHVILMSILFEHYKQLTKLTSKEAKIINASVDAD